MESNDFKLKMMESLLIGRELVLNKADSSLPLELFQYNFSGYHMMWCPSYDAHLSLFANTIAVCPIFKIMLRILVFYQKQNV